MQYNSIISEQDDTTSAETQKALTDADKTKIVDLLNSAIDNYNKYLSKKPDSEDKEKIETQISYINSEIKKYNPSRDNSLNEVESTLQDED